MRVSSQQHVTAVTFFSTTRVSQDDGFALRHTLFPSQALRLCGFFSSLRWCWREACCCSWRGQLIAKEFSTESKGHVQYSTAQYPARVNTNVFATFCVITVVSMFLHALHDRLTQCFRTSNVRPGNSFFGRHLYIYIYPLQF